MAVSQRKTTVAVLRNVLGPVYGREDKFAELIRRSISWVKKVSAGIEPLTGDVARVLSLETGIDQTWLLRGDPATPPVSASGGLYNERVFQLHRARLSKGRLEVQTIFELSEIVAEIAGIASAAAKQDMAAVFQWRLTEFIKTSRNEFGCDERSRRQTHRKTADVQLPRLVFRDDFVDSTVKRKISGQKETPYPRRARNAPQD